MVTRRHFKRPSSRTRKITASAAVSLSGNEVYPPTHQSMGDTPTSSPFHPHSEGTVFF